MLALFTTTIPRICKPIKDLNKHYYAEPNYSNSADYTTFSQMDLDGQHNKYQNTNTK